jgi:YkoY family integral membrane protein
MFGQTFDIQDLAVVGLLVVLEGVLSIDNALVLGLLARRLPKHLQSRALTYGLIGAFVFRFVAIATAAFLLKWTIAKLIGGLYLTYVAGKYFIFEARDPSPEGMGLDADGNPALIDQQTGRALSDRELEGELPSRSMISAAAPRGPGFWPTVAVIELTDIAFAVDSILAAVALVEGPNSAHQGGAHPKLWVIITGGMLGVILMRFAAVVFIRLLERFPRFETAAYLLVLVIGGKLVLDWAFNKNPEQPVLNFHSPETLTFWVFWMLMAACFATGFIPKRARGAKG